MRKVVRQVGVLSLGKIGAAVYAALGLLVGFMFAIISLLGGLASLRQSAGGAAFGMIFGVGAIIIFPIFYACVGAIVLMILGAVYNLVAGTIGGLELEVD